jgi:2-amino-4-hydroxy-6-hydroxymethyldihydropteridine diphosphokinase
MPDELVTVYIGLGSNLGDRVDNLAAAVERLAQIGTVVAASSLYETPPWDVGGDQPNYFNQVVAVQTALGPLEVVTELLAIEHSLGRTRREKNASRTLDLDLLLHGNSVVDASGVSVPHPRLHERAFVLVPLAEIAPNLVHPVLNQTIFELAEASDRSGVSLMRG